MQPILVGDFLPSRAMNGVNNERKMKWKIFEFLQSTNITPNTTLKEKASHNSHIKRIKWCKIAIMDLHEAGPIIRANFQGTQRLTKPTFYFL